MSGRCAADWHFVDIANGQAGDEFTVYVGDAVGNFYLAAVFDSEESAIPERPPAC